jgi:fumarylacetoacetase
MRIGDYTDFYTSIHHALNIGKLIGIPDDPSPNFRWLPIAYHGRVSSIGVSGQAVPPPARAGCARPAPARRSMPPAPGWTTSWSWAWWSAPATRWASRSPGQAEEHLFGICLLNDWSARDIQGWEMAPLGPFLAKNFATTVSPWIVTLEALAPYRCAFDAPGRPSPQPLPYLIDDTQRARGGFDIQLKCGLEIGRAPRRRAACRAG